jgi:hypothetical protein
MMAWRLGIRYGMAGVDQIVGHDMSALSWHIRW